MRTCESYIADMNLSIDGLLDEAEEQALQAHLAVCPKCRSLYQSYQDINAAILEAEVEPPKGLTHSVMTQIHQEKTRNKPKAILSRMRFTLVAAVIALVVVAAGTYLGHPRDNISAAAQAESAAVAEAAEAPAEPVAGEAALAAPPKVGATAEQPEAETEVDTQDAGAEEYAADAAPEAEGRSFDSAMEDTVESGAAGTALEPAVAALEALGSTTNHATLCTWNW